ncbi:uncharacterized protein [Haliotis asinina]|uniref:uncharacterized protein n=1 Tax=Haliotis asinina TaxID=109174 RepID=UPI00353197E2
MPWNIRMLSGTVLLLVPVLVSTGLQVPQVPSHECYHCRGALTLDECSKKDCHPPGACYMEVYHGNDGERIHADCLPSLKCILKGMGTPFVTWKVQGSRTCKDCCYGNVCNYHLCKWAHAWSTFPTPRATTSASHTGHKTVAAHIVPQLTHKAHVHTVTSSTHKPHVHAVTKSTHKPYVHTVTSSSHKMHIHAVTGSTYKPHAHAGTSSTGKPHTNPLRGSTRKAVIVTQICAVCNGTLCGVFPDRESDIRCPRQSPYCMNTVDYTEPGTRRVTKRCASKHECEMKWWISSSDAAECVDFSPGRQDYAFICHFCCTTDLCNRDIFPAKHTLYVGED